MLTISQLAAYAGVTVRAVRHYHQIGLLPEPERDAAGYRRYGARAVVALIKIRTLADAGVPLAQIGAMLDAGPDAFAETIRRLDRQIAAQIQKLETSRKQIAQLTAGDNAALPAAVLHYLDRLREIGASERMVEAERDGWILMAARWPEQISEWMPGKLAQLEDPRLVRLYLVLSELHDQAEVDEALLTEAVDILAALAEEAHASGDLLKVDGPQDNLALDLIDALADESDPRAEQMRALLRKRGWGSWTRMERLDE